MGERLGSTARCSSCRKRIPVSHVPQNIFQRSNPSAMSNSRPDRSQFALPPAESAERSCSAILISCYQSMSRKEQDFHRVGEKPQKKHHTHTLDAKAEWEGYRAVTSRQRQIVPSKLPTSNSLPEFCKNGT